MTLVPLGAQLASVDLPPPPPGADPREPSATLTPRQRGSRTPQRARSPLSSRDVSPVRPTGQNRSQSSELGSSPPLHHPVPRSTLASPSSSLSPISAAGAGPIAATGTSSASIPIHGHHLSRPSSPSSIHSSGSAIFERDIEFPPVASLSLNPNPPHQAHTLNHKSSRLAHLSHGSALDHTVPAVLDDAVEALTAGDGLSRGFEGLEIESPAPNASAIGMARQSSSSLPAMAGRKVSSGPGNLHSRSPSPISIASRTSSVASPAQSPPILGQLGSGLGPQSQNFQGVTPLSGTGSTSPTRAKSAGAGLGDHTTSQPITALNASVPRPAMPQRISTGPLLPGGWGFGGAASAPAPTPAAVPAAGAGANISPGLLPTTGPGAGVGSGDEALPSPVDESPVSPTGIVGHGSSSTPPAAIPSHLSPNKNKHRISFLSYNDLLLSVPTQVNSLEDITSGNLSPDHLPGTISPSVSTRSPVIGSPVNPLSGPGPAHGLGHGQSQSQSPPTGAGAGFTTPPPLGLGAAALNKAVQPRASWDAGSTSGGAVGGPAAGGRLGGLGFGAEGEWEREGLGKGLEQRLEEVAQNQNHKWDV